MSAQPWSFTLGIGASISPSLRSNQLTLVPWINSDINTTPSVRSRTRMRCSNSAGWPSASAGYYRKYQVLMLETNLYDTATQQLIWSMQSESIDA